MKAADLMVGDWVCLKDDTKYELPLKVDGVLTDDISLEGEGFLGGAEGLIRPVPITPEILEKNDIKKRRDEYAVFGWEGMKQWYVTLEDFKPQYDFWFITSSDRDLNIRGQIRYVHQLQHALRLCGLNELANNFKV